MVHGWISEAIVAKDFYFEINKTDHEKGQNKCQKLTSVYFRFTNYITCKHPKTPDVVDIIG
jgi:hypothetical protein